MDEVLYSVVHEYALIQWFIYKYYKQFISVGNIN